MIDRDNIKSTTVIEKITKNRKQMEEEIEKTAGESNSDNYISILLCP
jgi:hypothetical protein